MKGIRKLYHRNMELFLPLAAVLLGMLIMVLQKPLSVQAGMAVPMPQSFLGEYSYDAANWYPLDENVDLSAKNKDLYLRGHFGSHMYEDSRLYFYCDHIGSKLFVNGELVEQDIIMEIQQYGMEVHPSMCSREWKYHYIPEDVPAYAQVEIHLKNPHGFGNRNAYNDFLETLCCTPNTDEILSSVLYSYSQPYNVIGIIIGLVGVLLLCSAVVSVFMRLPIENTVVQTGLLAIFIAGCFLLDTVDLCFRFDNHIFNTYGWQICVMYSAHLVGIMTKRLLQGKRRRIAAFVMGLSAVANVTMILLAFSGVVLMYDNLRFWVPLQLVCCPVLMVCCCVELFSGNRKKILDILVHLMILIGILLDCTGFVSSIFFRGIVTKVAVLLFFVVKLVQFAASIIANFRASNKVIKLERELEESRIAMMLSQIHPHFIFNVLGTIRGLCRENPEQAWVGLGDFSEYLRANINALTNEKTIPFVRELDHVASYLRLEHMRLGEDLKVVYDIQEKDFYLPPLTLQPLVENAVKHGLFYKKGGGTVAIQSRRENGKIILSVQDDGLGFEVAAQETDFAQRKHHGLENVRSRVEKMMGGTLHIDSHPDQGSIVTLEFPVEGQV